MQLSIFLEHLLQAHEQSGKTVEEIFSIAKNNGISGIETNASFLASQPQLQKELSEAGLQVSQLYENYGWEDFANDTKMQNHIKTAKAVGAQKILFIPPYFSSLKDEAPGDEMSRVKIMIKKICKMAESEGITVTMEDFDNLKSPSSKICYLREYLDEIPELQITFDTGNFLANGEDILEAYPVLEDRIVNVHCKDRLADVSSCATGTGIIPFEKIFGLLKLRNYNGNYTIEHFDIKNQLEAMIKSSLNLQTMLKE